MVILDFGAVNPALSLALQQWEDRVDLEHARVYDLAHQPTNLSMPLSTGQELEMPDLRE